MKALNMVFGLALTLTAVSGFNARAEDAGENVCNFERHVWGHLNFGSAGADAEDKRKVLVLGKIQNGDSSPWIKILKGPDGAPELVPESALEKPPVGTCVREGSLARTLREFKEGLKEEFGVGEYNPRQKVGRNWPNDSGVSPAPLKHDLVAGSDSRTSAR